MLGGPLDGEVLTFVRNDDGDVVSTQVGNFELSNVSLETSRDLPITAQYPAPKFVITPEKETTFGALIEIVLEKADGDENRYVPTVGVPKIGLE